MARWDNDADFTMLMGKTLTACRNIDNERLVFETEDGKTYQMDHSQDCCEHVYVESIVGDLEDLIGTPILLAEVVTDENDPPGYKREYSVDSQTWTFYKLRTIKGSVDIRWYGSSNGYYSESVDFYEVK